jgi:hypothetical protein
MPLTPGLEIPFGIQPVNPVPVDTWSGPYYGPNETTAKAAANLAIPQAIRFQSLQVRLIIAGVPYIYWYDTGITDTDLHVFSTGGGGGSGVSGYSGYSGFNANNQSVTYTNSFSAGQVIYKTPGGYSLALADDIYTSEVIGVVQSANSSEFTYVINGYISGLTGIEDATCYYLSDTVPGQLTMDAPTVSGSVIKPVLIGTSTTTGVVVEFPSVVIGSTNNGTSGYLARWTGSHSLGNSSIFDTGPDVTIAADTTIVGNINIVGHYLLSGVPFNDGFSGYSGTSGYSSYSGFSGYSGTSGHSGWSGLGISGYSGISGFSGNSTSGYSGISGFSGVSGYSGSGISGYSGNRGLSGWSGISGFSGYIGQSGYSGTSGVSGYRGSGVSGYSGWSGISGYSGAGADQTLNTTSNVSFQGLSATSITTTGNVSVGGNLSLTGGFRGVEPSYTFAEDAAASASWYLLGTWTTVQTGEMLYIRLLSHAGYNGLSSGAQVTELIWTTSNGSSQYNGSTGPMYAAGLASINSRLGTGTGSGNYQAPSSFRIVQVSQTQYQVYGYFASYTRGSNYSVQSSSSSSWVHSGTAVSAPSNNYVTITPDTF